MQTSGTIAAIATCEGEGGIAIVRMSGELCEKILSGCFAPKAKMRRMRSHRLYYGNITFAGEIIDEVMAVIMRAPSSYTREDVAEIHCHGGRMSAAIILDIAIKLGARIAEPGEFTRRAFINGRIDLSRAEAVMQLIGASSRLSARASARQLTGGVSAFVDGVANKLTDIMALIEASTDFPEEVEEVAISGEIALSMRKIAGEISRRADGRSAQIIRQGARIVLAGRPNAGKSSLMNALLATERAIVTEIPGTTRDVLTEKISLGGVLAELSDTAGLRETDDPVESIGVKRARAALDGADIVLAVMDASEPLTAEDAQLAAMRDGRFVFCENKADLPRHPQFAPQHAPAFAVSATTGQGMDELTRYLSGMLSDMAGEGDSLTVRRHLELATDAAQALIRGAEGIEAGFALDAAAVDIRDALALLGAITGRDASEDVISRVFENFCVGK